jgi:putative transposase
MEAAAVRTIFAQPNEGAVGDQLDSIADMLGRQFPAVEVMLREAAVDICAFAAFPRSHWKKVRSTNPLERVAPNEASAVGPVSLDTVTLSHGPTYMRG